MYDEPYDKSHDEPNEEAEEAKAGPIPIISGGTPATV